MVAVGQNYREASVIDGEQFVYPCLVSLNVPITCVLLPTTHNIIGYRAYSIFRYEQQRGILKCGRRVQTGGDTVETVWTGDGWRTPRYDLQYSISIADYILFSL